MNLVDDAKDFWRWWSMRLMALAGSWPLIWAQLPDDAKNMIPDVWEMWIPTTLILAAMIARPIQQREKA